MTRPRRAVLIRSMLILTTAVVVATLTPWAGSHLPLAPMLVELAASVALWEIGIALGVAVVRSHMGRDAFATSNAALVGAVLIGSIPATLGLFTALHVLGERIDSWPRLYGQTLVLGLILAFARRGLRRALPATTVETTERGPDRLAGFLQRNAPALAGGRLVALQADDHYLRLHTDRGSALVLMRLRDAVAELGDDAGWQPHRSWWIAGTAEPRVVREGASWRLTLPGGLVVPVSRSKARVLRERAGRDPVATVSARSDAPR